jgi:hypothetical protein
LATFSLSSSGRFDSDPRNILRPLAAAREHGTIPKAQVQAKDEIERMKNNGSE